MKNPVTHRITDYFSFYSLPSAVINSKKHGVLDAAYLFYYATDIAFLEEAEADGRLKKRLEKLIGDALIIAGQAKFDVFNALTLMDNVPILKDLKVCLFSLSRITSCLTGLDSLERETGFLIFISTTGGRHLWQDFKTWATSPQGRV